MKVLLINGSSHKEGNTFHALSMAAKTLESQGIETEIMQIGNKPVRGCIACGVCKQKGNNRCTFDDDVCNRFLEKAKDADGFIFGSPTYYGQPNGALLAVVQRMLYAGGAQTMNMAFEMMNMPIVTSQYWNMVYGQKPGEAELDEEGMQTMRTMANNMAWLLKRIHQGGDPQYPERESWTPMNFIRTSK